MNRHLNVTISISVNKYQNNIQERSAIRFKIYIISLSKFEIDIETESKLTMNKRSKSEKKKIENKYEGKKKLFNHEIKDRV